MQAEVKDVMKQSIYNVIKITEVPVTKRTEQMRHELSDAEQYISNHFEEFFNEFSNDLNVEVVEFIERTDFQRYVQYIDVLSIPTIPKHITLEDIADLNEKFYGLITTLGSAIAFLEPVTNRFLYLEKRNKTVFKSLVSTQLEWKSNALYEVMVSSETAYNLRSLEALVETAKKQMEALNAGQAIISRIQTLRQGIPVDARSVEVNEHVQRGWKDRQRQAVLK